MQAAARGGARDFGAVADLRDGQVTLALWNAWITAVPRASDVMKLGSPVSASMRLAGEATMGGAIGGW